MASYDDAAFRLDADARSLLASLGSNISKTISFRDGWVFIGAKNLPSFPTKEAHIPNDKVHISSKLPDMSIINVISHFRNQISMVIGLKLLK